MFKKTPYQILGLEGDFTQKDIKLAYRKAIKENPPEKNQEQFTKISDAYDSLTNEEYFLNSLRGNHFIFEVSLDLDTKKEKINNSKYLKEMFEVPFEIIKEDK